MKEPKCKGQGFCEIKVCFYLEIKTTTGNVLICVFQPRKPKTLNSVLNTKPEAEEIHRNEYFTALGTRKGSDLRQK